MIYSGKQNRQLYVAKAVGTVAADSVAGTIEVDSVAGTLDKEVFFKYKGADTPLRSDLIPVKNIKYAKAVSAKSLEEPLKQVLVTLDPEVNEGKPVSGQDYILNIAFRQFYGMSDEDQYFKFGAVHAIAGMTEAQFYQKLADSLKLNFSREIGTYLTFEATATGLLVKEVEQPWILGKYAQEKVYFEVYPRTIYVDGDEVTWGVT